MKEIDVILIKEDYTFQKEDGQWYFWDECGLEGGGPYLTKILAQEGLQRYADQLCKETLEDMQKD